MDPFANDAQLKRWRDACCGAGTDPLPLTKNEGAAILDRLCAAEEWQLAVADGLGYVNRPEGQSGYKVAEPSVIIDAFRAAEAARDAAQASDKRAREMFDVTRHRICDRLGLPHGTSWSNVEEAVRALASPRATPPEAAPRRCVVRGCDCGGALHVWPATPPEATMPRGTFPGDLDRMPSGHTRHCEARLRWGDGECECGANKGPK